MILPKPRVFTLCFASFFGRCVDFACKIDTFMCIFAYFCEIHSSIKLRTRICCKNEVCALYRCRTLVFYDRFNQQVSKTLCFCGRSGLIWSCQGLPGSPPGLQIFSKNMQKLGFWKHGREKACKNTGFCTGESSTPRFYSIFMSLSKTSMDFSWCICLPGGLPGPLPSQARKL